MSRKRRKISHQRPPRLKLKPESARQITGVILVVTAIFLFIFPAAYKSYTNRPLPSVSLPNNFGPIKIAPDLVASQNKVKTFPRRLIIAQLKIDLPVVPAKIVNGYWETSLDSASYGLGSGLPGESGNTVIFAHARAGLFLPLREAKPGMNVYILTDSGWLDYKIAEIKEVKPQDTQVIGQTSEEILTLFTCTGFLDSKRLIVIAQPIN